MVAYRSSGDVRQGDLSLEDLGGAAQHDCPAALLAFVPSPHTSAPRITLERASPHTGDSTTKKEMLMARVIVMPDASHLRVGISGTVLYAAEVRPEHLDDLHSSEQILEHLERAVREAGAVAR